MLILDHDVLEVILSAFMEQLKPALNSKCVEMCGLLWSSIKRFDYVVYAFVMVCSQMMMIQMLTLFFCAGRGTFEFRKHSLNRSYFMMIDLK